MEYIRVTKENLEKEHICCAISNNKDVQVSSKKAWLADRFEEGLAGFRSMRKGICTSTACGCPALSRDTDILPIC